MSSREPKKRRVLKVHVSFEASRMADECLAAAYEQVIPLVSRVTPGLSAAVDSQPTRRSGEGVSLFDQSDSGYCDSVTNS